MSIGLLTGLFPVCGSELEDAALGPRRQQAEQVAEVGFGLDVVHVTAGDVAGGSGVELGAVAAADEGVSQ